MPNDMIPGKPEQHDAPRQASSSSVRAVCCCLSFCLISVSGRSVPGSSFCFLLLCMQAELGHAQHALLKSMVCAAKPPDPLCALCGAASACAASLFRAAQAQAQASAPSFPACRQKSRQVAWNTMNCLTRRVAPDKCKPSNTPLPLYAMRDTALALAASLYPAAQALAHPLSFPAEICMFMI